jgi:hypothetical protein
MGCMHAVGLVVLAVAFLGIGILRERHRKAHPDREPADISPFTASLWSGQREQGYKPAGIYAVTPGGIRVRVSCPHRFGHRSPGLAVACGEQVKARIEKTGR